MKFVAIAVVVFATVGILLSTSILDQFGIERNYLYIGLGALLITTLVAFRGVFLIVIVLILSLMINMPDEMLESIISTRKFLSWW